MAEEPVWRPYGYYRDESNIAEFVRREGIDEYDDLLPTSQQEVIQFWDTMVDDLGIIWDQDYDRTLDTSDGIEFPEWFVGGKLNAIHTILDRWAEETPEETMYIWEDERGHSREYSYRDIRDEANRVANGMREFGVSKGDRVGVLFPLHPHGIITLLACLRVGAVGVPIFPGYGAGAMQYRLQNSGVRILFLADGYQRSGDQHPIAEKVDSVLPAIDSIELAVLYENTGDGTIKNCPSTPWAEFTSQQSSDCPTVSMNAEDTAFIAYTSGTTGDPKGTIHTHASFLLMGMKDVKYHFDVKQDDALLWVTEFGWIIIPIWFMSGAPALGATTVLMQGSPTAPGERRIWEIIDRYDVTTFGISPSGSRKLRRIDERPAETHDLSSLRILGSTGEPWDEETWKWWFAEVGREEVPIINVSGGTEIGGNLLGPTPLTPLKPGTLAKPAPGIALDIYDEDGTSVDEGYLVVEQPVPGMTRSLTGGDDRYLEEYWSDFDGVWNQNDWAVRDQDGYWFLTGRSDDTMNVGGRRITAPAIENAINSHRDVHEVVVVGFTPSGSGEKPVAFVVSEREMTDQFRDEIEAAVSEGLGAPFKPWRVHSVSGFPRTQSGKVPRGIIESCYGGDLPSDTSTLSNTAVLEDFPSYSGTESG